MSFNFRSSLLPSCDTLSSSHHVLRLVHSNQKLDIRSTSFFHFPSPNHHAKSPSRPSVGYFTYPFASLSTLMLICLYIFAKVREGDLDLVSTYSVWSLASSEDITAMTVWSLMLEIRVFYCFFLQPSGLSLCWPSIVS